MQLVENFDPVPPLRNRKKIKNIIEQSLLGDWIVRVEYVGHNAQGHTDWLQWGSTFFAMTSSEDVIQAIDSCYDYFPDREIRINAEKVQPAMRIAYSVHRPSEPVSNKHVPVNLYVASVAANQEWKRSAVG